MRRTRAAILMCIACALPGAAFAQGAPAAHTTPAGVLVLNAQANTEVPSDVVHITLFHEEQASDPSTLTATLSRITAQALQKTKGQTAVTVSSGAFTVSPSTDRDGHINAWRGRSELLLTSSDIDAASQLAAKLGPTMQVGDVSFSLSPQQQRATETSLTNTAIASFRQQALEAAKAFGYSGYTIREVNVGQNGAMPTARPMMMMMGGAAPRAAPPVPLEAGKAMVTVTVSGSVQMTR